MSAMNTNKEFLTTLINKLNSKGYRAAEEVEMEPDFCTFVIKKGKKNTHYFFYPLCAPYYEFRITLQFNTNDKGDTEVKNLVTNNQTKSMKYGSFSGAFLFPIRNSNTTKYGTMADQNELQSILDLVTAHSQTFFKQ